MSTNRRVSQIRGAEPLVNWEGERPDWKLDETIANVFCDGGVMKANPSALGGAWAFCYTNKTGVVLHQASGLLMPTAIMPQITNNYAEAVAVIHALMELPDGWIGNIFTDSELTIRRFDNLRTAGPEPMSYGNFPLALSRKAYMHLKRTGGTFWHHLAGHPTKLELNLGSKNGKPVSIHQVWCDEECTRIMQVYLAGR